jgi:cytochrome c peroxidase
MRKGIFLFIVSAALVFSASFPAVSVDFNPSQVDDCVPRPKGAADPEDETGPQAREAPRTGTYDATLEAQSSRQVPITRPEQKKTDVDTPDKFSPDKVQPSSTAFKRQPDEGKVLGFDFYRDPLNSKKPMMSFEEIRDADIADRPKVTTMQRELLERRYNLKPQLSKDVFMTRGKPLAVGPTVKLGQGMTWEKLAEMTPAEIRSKNLFPYPSLPHPKQSTGGQVFPRMQILMFPRLERFDVEFDIPKAFLPEFPPAIFLSNRPEMGDVSRGEVVSINNYYLMFKDLLTPVQLDGLRMLLTPFPQEEFNATDDRKTCHPSLGVTCLDCHVNGHTTGQFHLSPDIRPEERRFRLDTTSLRGLFNQQIHGSKRSLRSVEDFTEFEFRTAYFNGDAIHSMKKGFTIIPRIQVAHMAQMQNMFDFPPAPKLDPSGFLDRTKATPAELEGEKVFFGKGRCASCHVPPTYMNHQMNDLQLERFLQEPGDGPIKTFTLRGIKESPPYLHDGRCFTLEDTVEFFNLVLGLKLTKEEKAHLTAFMRIL